MNKRILQPPKLTFEQQRHCLQDVLRGRGGAYIRLKDHPQILLISLIEFLGPAVFANPGTRWRCLKERPAALWGLERGGDGYGWTLRMHLHSCGPSCTLTPGLPERLRVHQRLVGHHWYCLGRVDTAKPCPPPLGKDTDEEPPCWT